MSEPTQGPWTVTYSNAGVSQTNTSFYDDNQIIHFLANNGLPMVNTSIGSIDAAVWYNTACAINFSAQAGGCAVMFLVVLVLSKASKHRTPIFILNVLSLLFGFLRGLLFALYSISSWIKVYPYFSYDFSAIPTRSYVLTVSGSIMPLLMTTTVNLSLVLQAYTVTQNIEGIYRYFTLAMSGLVFFLAVGFRFAAVITNCIAIIKAVSLEAQWVLKGTLYTETIAIWYFSAIFTSKLVYTLHYRRKHGWKQWSGVKILAAMGGCTMLIPSLFAILEYVNDDIVNSFPEAGTLTLTIVALLLPLSSLWASMAIDVESSSLSIPNLSGYNKDMSETTISNRSIVHKHGNRDEEKHGFGDYSPSTINNTIESRTVQSEPSGRDSTEIDLQAMGVRVKKSYSLKSSKEEAVLG